MPERTGQPADVRMKCFVMPGVDFLCHRRARAAVNKTVDGIPEVYQRLGKLEMPVLLIWGQDDRTLPFEQSRGILSAVPRAEFRLIENCGHVPHYEKSEEVNPIIQQFLNSK